MKHINILQCNYDYTDYQYAGLTRSVNTNKLFNHMLIACATLTQFILSSRIIPRNIHINMYLNIFS
jgi:hypothetical protein